MRDRDALTPPERTVEDAQHALAKSVITAVVPGSGELFSWLVVPRLEERRQAWMSEVADRICALERAGRCDVAALRGDDAFLDIVLRASQAALRTSDRDKRAALRNAVLNTALAPSSDASLREILIGLVDELTSAHLAALDLIDDPTSWAAKRGVTWPRGMVLQPGSFLARAFPQLASVSPLAGEIWRALFSRGLVEPEGTMFENVSGGVRGGRPTDLGKKLLEFVKEPE